MFNTKNGKTIDTILARLQIFTLPEHANYLYYTFINAVFFTSFVIRVSIKPIFNLITVLVNTWRKFKNSKLL